MKRLKWFIGFIIFGFVVGYLAGHHKDYLETTAKIHAPEPVGETGSVLCPDTDTFDSYWNEEMDDSGRITGEFIASKN